MSCKHDFCKKHWIGEWACMDCGQIGAKIWVDRLRIDTWSKLAARNMARQIKYLGNYN